MKVLKRFMCVYGIHKSVGQQLWGTTPSLSDMKRDVAYGSQQQASDNKSELLTAAELFLTALSNLSQNASIALSGFT